MDVLSAFNYAKEFSDKARHEFDYVYGWDRVEMLNPVNQDHRSVIVFGFLKFLAHQLDKIIQLERNIPTNISQ